MSLSSFIDAKSTEKAASLMDENIMPYSEEGFTNCDDGRYPLYQNYHDENLSYISKNKDITVDSSQINITQETRSQFIPFEMARYYDGIDLMDMRISIHFLNANNDQHYSSPVNVSYSADKIRFCWLVDEYVTQLAGDIIFEIIAEGTNEKGETYCWKTKPNGKLNVLQALKGNEMVKPDDDWYSSFVKSMDSKIAQAKTYADEARTEAQDAKNAALEVSAKIDTVKGEIESDVQDYFVQKITESLSAYYTKTEINEIVTAIRQEIQDIDLSDYVEEINQKIDSIDGLANFNVTYENDNLTFYNGETVIKTIQINSDPTAEWVESYNKTVDSKISSAVSVVQDAFDEYTTATDNDLQSIHENIDNLPETLKTDYYTKESIDAILVDKANKSDITSLESKVSSIESTSNTNKTNITTLGAKVSDLESAIENIDTSPKVTYEATYDEEQIYTLWEIEGEGDEEVRTPKGQFKIHGGGGSSTSSVLKIEYVTKSPVIATVNDQVVIKYNFSGTDSSGDIVSEGTATWRVGSTIVATNMAVYGENSFDITEYLSIGTQRVSLSITDDAGSLVTKSWTVQKVDVRIESTFNDKLTYPIGTVLFDYTPYGAISKTIHFVLDGKELSSVTTTASGIPMAYTLPEQTHGAHFLEVFMTADINNSVIESNHIYKDILWYDSTSDIPVIGCTQQDITAKQYDTTNIVYTVFDPKTETPNVTLYVDGEIVSTLTLESNVQTWQYKTSKIGPHTLTIACRGVEKVLNVNIEELDINLEPVTAGLEFDFNPSGKSNNDNDRLWSDGDVAMSVSDNFDWTNGGYQIDSNGDQYFCIKAGTSAAINYKLFEDDAKRNGKEFKLVFKTANVRKSNATFLECMDGLIGIQMNVHETYIKADAGTLYLPYSENDIIEFEFNINKNTDDIPMVMGYEDGVSTRCMVYSDTHSFTQLNPQDIIIGSSDCDVYIYRLKVFSAALTDRGILNNFIADARNADEMIARYYRNQIYDENGQLTPESVANSCKDLKVIKLECPHFTNDKKDFVKADIQCIHKNGDPVLDNWKAANCYHSGQGTTSNEYGQAARNMDLLMCFDGTYKNKKIPFDENYLTQITFGDGTVYENGTGKITLTRTSVPTNYLNIKVNVASSEHVNNAILQRRYNEFLPYVSVAQNNNPYVKNSMEFVNCVVFLRETDPDISTHREFQDNEWHFYSIGNIGDSKKTDYTRVNDASDPKEFIVEIMDNTLPNSTFSGTEEALAALDADQFDENGTYGFRYEMDGITDEQHQANMQVWKDFYRFVVNSTDEEFVSQLSNWFIVDSALYFYLFTERYTMIDNRAKNTFWHYGICEDGKYRFDFWDYDNDTALGINNSGELTMTYGKEDIDYRIDGNPSSGYIFNAAESLFFRRIRNLMNDKLREMFLKVESQGGWSAQGLIDECDKSQNQFPEELWRIHNDRVYLRTFREGTPRFLNQMANGKKKYHRRQFERSQEKYMATKYFGTVATSDQIMFRCNTPVDAVVAPDYTLHLTPYADMYLSVMFGATYRTQIRAKAGVKYDIQCPFSTMDDTAVLIYCASQIQSMGDISACYIHDNDFSKASMLEELIIGNTTEGYQNTFLTNIGIGNNTLLKKLDIQNTPNLSQALNLSACQNLTELYAFGSGLTGVIFANGGTIKIAQLPAITSIVMKNLDYLTGLEIVSYDNLTTIVIENCDTVDVKDLLERSDNINRVRITGINWELDDISLLDAIYEMYGIDKNGYNISQSVLSGVVHVPIMKEQKLSDYQAAWPDLEITYNTFINQFIATFKNDNGDILDVQYVDKGSLPVDPITRENNPIEIPTKESSVSTEFTFDSWDNEFTPMFSNQTYTATYTGKIRNYTVRYLNHGAVLKEQIAPYASSVFYDGDIPTYTLEESAFKYYLFARWDKSGYVDGDKDINAVFDSCEYTSTYFDGKDIKDMRPVEVYALMKNNRESDYVEDMDEISFTMGNDYNFGDIEQHEIITQKTIFNGKNYIDTGLTLFNMGKSFVLAVDYEFINGTAQSVLFQCYQSDGSYGFKMGNGTSPKISWGTSTSDIVLGKRDIIVLRYIYDEKVLHIYKGNLPKSTIDYSTLENTRHQNIESELVFGCAKADDGIYENFSEGNIYWAKVWFTDLGDEACRNIAGWTHEEISLGMSGFKKYYYSDNSKKRSSMSFLANHLLSNNMIFNNSTKNSGGWEASSLNAFLNSRFYDSIPIEWKQLIKEVKITGSIGGKSTEVSVSNCYISIPAVIELDSTQTKDPYAFEDVPISYMTNESARRRYYPDNPSEPGSYWTRTPNVQYDTYMMVVSGGNITSYVYPSNELGVCIEISIGV